VPIVPYNSRTTDDPKDIQYRVEDRITEHSEGVQLKDSISHETYNHRTGVERTNDAVYELPNLQKYQRCRCWLVHKP
jgi:hypothetical protein